MTQSHRDKAHDQPTRGNRRAARSPADPADSQRTPVTERTRRYLIAPAPPLPLYQLSMESAAGRIVERLTEDPDIHVVRTIRSTARPARADAVPLLVVEMPPARAARLAASPDLLVEPDQPLRYGAAALPVIDPGVTPRTEAMPVALLVTSEDGTPLKDASIYVVSELPHDHAVTDRTGTAKIMLTGPELDSLTGIYVQPRSGHWNTWLPRPQLSSTTDNPIICSTLDPTTAEASWSRTAMGFDRLPPTFRGHGVRIAIIDSGIDVKHADLVDRVVGGLDLVTQDEKAWQTDALASGTGTAGIIAATEENSRVIGLAPEAELRICKVTPGGHLSDLVEAIDHCIAEEVDIITLGVGTPHASWLVAQKLEEARQAGVACIAGAGNTHGPVMFPARLPSVLTVGAIGRLGTFPADSYHATQPTGTPTADGFFTARLSAAGPQLDVCAPGVAVLTTVPTGGLGALDGTTIAAAHITALAALILAHHPDFRSGFLTHGAARVERLFAIIQASCRPLAAIDPMHVGAGLPDAVTAVGLAPSVPMGFHPAAQSPAAMPWAWQSGPVHSLPLMHTAMHTAGPTHPRGGGY